MKVAAVTLTMFVSTAFLVPLERAGAQEPEGGMGILLDLSSEASVFPKASEKASATWRKGGKAPTAWYGGRSGSFVVKGEADLGEAFYYFQQEDLKEHYKLQFEGIRYIGSYPYAIYHEVSLDGNTEYEDYKWALPAFTYPGDTGLPAYHERPHYPEYRHSFVYVTPLTTKLRLKAERNR